MEAKIFVIGFPSMKGLMEEITSLIEEAFDKPKIKKCEHKTECRFREKPQSFERDLTPPRFKNHSFMPPAPIPQWGIGGKPADENLRFGAEFAIDEPRRSDYDNREDFEYDHQLFDEFVSAGEDCVERGLARPEGVTAHRCNAIRKKLNEAPPMGVDLIGETDWWNDEDFDWDY
jgi:hypothetical protein